ncbi:hypothetical protein PIB30_037672 [Stylosanthes scabra]|uniref:Thylakoid soluble phosphoprotein TSP9 n=1 Tax=Stylosanthes scabra TaxID=79078 RepID=A0ABU6UD33_9FABA|nr:hypothetical protein [Stylosanthes scabra]
MVQKENSSHSPLAVKKKNHGLWCSTRQMQNLMPHMLKMASMIMSFAPATTVRVYAATAAKGAGGSKEEKGLLDWILGGLQKEDQLLETDPILNKVEGKTTGGTTGGRRNSVAVPPKKKGGFGGLFAKNE